MKGVVFVALAEMVQDKYGYKLWNQIVEEANLISKGVYTSALNYDDEEAVKILNVISKKLDKKSEDLLKIFGIYLLKFFVRRYPYFFEGKDFKQFLKDVDGVVHNEIKKLSPDSVPPKLVVFDEGKIIRLQYYSKRKLCKLAYGLIKGTAIHYGVAVEIDETKCVNRDDDFCEFEIKILNT